MNEGIRALRYQDIHRERLVRVILLQTGAKNNHSTVELYTPWYSMSRPGGVLFESILASRSSPSIQYLVHCSAYVVRSLTSCLPVVESHPRPAMRAGRERPAYVACLRIGDSPDVLLIHIQCDAKPEGCTPCARTGRKCPGYRKQVDLMFRDQSSNVIRKAKAAEAKKSKSPEPQPAKASPQPTSVPEPSVAPQPTAESDAPLTAADELSLVSRKWDPILSIGPTMDERATCYFVFHHLVGVQSPSRGLLDNLLMMFQSNSVDENLLTAVKAVSYASYAHHLHNTELTEVSRWQYTKAVNLTNAALRSDESAAKDSTLLSVMILGMYEILTGSTQRSLQAWMEHVRGSAALIKMRGEEQLKTPQGRRLFVQASIGILTSCVQLNIPVPRHMVELMYKVPDYFDQSISQDDIVHVAYGIHMKMIEVNQFRASVEKGIVSDKHEIVSMALELDSRLNAIPNDTPPEFRYYVVKSKSDTDFAFQGTYHVYYDLLTAHMWNSIRVFRILLHEQIRDTLLKGFSARPPVFTKAEHTIQFQKSTDICATLQADILGSVPQHLGYVGHDNIRDESYPAIWGDCIINHETQGSFGGTVLPDGPGAQAAAIECLPRFNCLDVPHRGKTPSAGSQSPSIPDIRASGCFNLIWPIWLAGAMDVVTEEVQTYASKSLRLIDESVGIRQATMLAKAIESRTIVLDAWKDRERFEIVEE